MADKIGVCEVNDLNLICNELVGKIISASDINDVVGFEDKISQLNTSVEKIFFSNEEVAAAIELALELALENSASITEDLRRVYKLFSQAEDKWPHCGFINGFKSDFKNQIEKLATVDISPIPSLITMMHILLDVEILEIDFEKILQNISGRDTADLTIKHGVIAYMVTSVLTDACLATGYSKQSLNAASGLAVQTWLIKYIHHVESSFASELALRFSELLTSHSELDAIHPIKKCSELKKWLQFAKVKDAESQEKLNDSYFFWFSILQKVSQRKENGVAKFEENPEPGWNQSGNFQNIDDQKLVMLEVIKAIRDIAMTGRQSAKDILLHLFFSRKLEKSVYDGKSDTDVKNLFFPWVDDEAEAYIEFKINCGDHPTDDQKDALTYGKFRNRNSQLLQAEYDRDFFSLNASRQSMINTLCSRAMRCNYKKNGLHDNASVSRADLIDNASTSSIIFNIFSNDASVLTGLVDCLCLFVSNSQLEIKKFLPLIKNEIEKYSLENHVEPQVFRLRYSSSKALLSKTLLGCISEIDDERIHLLKEAHQRKDISATYFLSKERSFSVDTRLQYLEDVIDATSELESNKQSRKYGECRLIYYPELSDEPHTVSDTDKKLHATLYRAASEDHRLLLKDKLIQNERDKREAVENLMAMFAHKFRGPVDSILFNTAHQQDASVYVDAARTMNGLLDVFGVVSTTPDKLTASLRNDVSGTESPLNVLAHALHLALMQLLSPRNCRRMSPHFLSYAKRYGTAPADLKLSEWCRVETWEALEQQLRAQWETEVGSMGADCDVVSLLGWLSQHIISVAISDFDESQARFAKYGPTASLLTVVFTEVLVNALKHTEPGSSASMAIEWKENADMIDITCSNPSTRDSRSRESSKGSGRGHKFLKLIADHLQGQFVSDVLKNPSTVTMRIPTSLILKA